MLACRENTKEPKNVALGCVEGVLGAEGFTAGIRYTGTYGVNPLPCLQGKPALFSLANSWAKFYQVDTHRKPIAIKDEF